MLKVSRRDWLCGSSAAMLGLGSVGWNLGSFVSSNLFAADRTAADTKTQLDVSSFRVNVTPPLGHSCCGGWIKPVESVSDNLEAIGVVISGPVEPIVLCAVDWTGILNQTHLNFRTEIAKALHTSPDRVAIQCVHQHNAPFACEESQAFVSKHDELPSICDIDFVMQSAAKIGTAARDSLDQRKRLTHVEVGRARVEKVASNRRIVDEKGKLFDWRGSRSSSPRHQEIPEGKIDPWLKTIRLCSEDKPIAAMHFYATHPMSFYGDGIVTSDFVGLARKRKQLQDDSCTQIYWTGCSGNVAAGKYNDGSPKAREELTNRIFAAIESAEEELERFEIEAATWRTQELIPEPRETLEKNALLKQLSNSDLPTVDRNRSAFQLAWLDRLERQQPIILSSLNLGPATILNLPAESFIEYQLAAQEIAGDRFLATAAYGDGGPWYIPTKEAYPQGGYEVSVAWSDPKIDPALRSGIASLVGQK